MTIIVTAKVTDGVVLAADSAASYFFPGSQSPIKIYNHANKVFNLVKTWPIGAMMCGHMSIGAASIETLSKDLRAKLANPDDPDYGLNQQAYTIEEVAQKARKFLFEECYTKTYAAPPADFRMYYRICGYSANAGLAEIWEFVIAGNQCPPPYRVQGPDEFGMRWNGETEALDRLILGASGAVKGYLLFKNLVQPPEIDLTYNEMVSFTGTTLVSPAMPIQDAINVARFAVDTASKFTKFGLRPETIGGPVEIAAITKHEGFKWIARKHYYTAELNPETNHGR